MEEKLRQNEEKDKSFKGFCQDSNVWNCKTICQDCLNKIGGGCDIFGEEGSHPNPIGVQIAQSKGKCEWYIKKERD